MIFRANLKICTFNSLNFLFGINGQVNLVAKIYNNYLVKQYFQLEYAFKFHWTRYVDLFIFYKRMLFM